MPIKPDEVVVLILGLAVLLFLLFKGERLKELPRIGLFLSSYAVLVGAWVLTILEDLFLRDTMNLLEHVCYAGSTVLLMLWIGFTFLPGRKERP
jgi:hypothetical protein